MSTFKNENSLRTIEAQIVQKLENNEARPKFTGSYKKKRAGRRRADARKRQLLTPNLTGEKHTISTLVAGLVDQTHIYYLNNTHPTSSNSHHGLKKCRVKYWA